MTYPRQAQTAKPTPAATQHHHVPPCRRRGSTEMCFCVRQHRLLALSASDDVAGTWKHISVASTSAPPPYTTPLCRHVNAITSETQEGPKHAGGQTPPVNIFPFEAPWRHDATWNRSRQPQIPPHHKIPARKRKNAAGVVGMRFGASWRCRR